MSPARTLSRARHPLRLPGATRFWPAAVALFALLALLGAAGCTGARSGSAAPPQGELPPNVVWTNRLAVVPDPSGSAVAVALVTPGSGWELPGTEGLTHLAARAVLEAVRPSLERLGAEAAVSCERAAFTFTMVSPPDTWEDALHIFMEGVLRPAPGPEAIEDARTALVETLRRDASPARQARLAVRQALHGDVLAHEPWAGPGCGLPEAVAGFSPAEVRAGTHRFDREGATAAITGPVPPEGTVERLRAWVPDSLPVPRLRSPDRSSRGRRYVQRGTVTAWTAVAFPYAAGADEEVLRLLGDLVLASVSPRVDRPEVFDAGFELEPHGSGGSLIVHVTTEPEAALEYGERVAARVGEIAADGPPAPLLERTWLRHRGRRLRELATPEARMAVLARDLILRAAEPRSGWPSSLPPAPARLRNAARSLGAPAFAVVGPPAARPAAWGGSSP